MQNLDCANCGAKIERALNAMPEIDEATLTFTTKKLRVSAKDYNGLLEKMQAVTDKVEEGVVLLEAESKPSLAPELEERKKSGGIFSELSENRRLSKSCWAALCLSSPNGWDWCRKHIICTS